MRFRSLFLSAMCLMAVSMVFTSCDDDDDDDWDGGMPHAGQRVYFLNEGNYQSNDAGIDLYCPFAPAGQRFTGNIYYGQNGVGMGDTAQDLIEYNGYLYATVFGSNLLIKMDYAGRKLKEVAFTAEEGQPRYVVAEDGKLYVTLYSGNVMKLDAMSLAKEGMVKVGKNPEWLVEEDGRLYVANSGWGADKTLSVIDLRTFTVTKTIEVAVNPERVLECGDMIFVQAYGENYTYPVQMYNPLTGQVRTIGKATKMAEYEGVVYMAYSETDWTTYKSVTTFSSYHVRTGELKQNHAYLQAPEAIKTGSVYMLDIDPDNGDFYVSVSDYMTNGTVYRFNHAGELLETLLSSGLNPKKAVFVDAD